MRDRLFTTWLNTCEIKCRTDPHVYIDVMTNSFNGYKITTLVRLSQSNFQATSLAAHPFYAVHQPPLPMFELY